MQTEWSKKIVSLLEKTSAGGRYRSFEIFDDWLSICDATLQQLPSHMKNRSRNLPMVDAPETVGLMKHMWSRHSLKSMEYFSQAFAVLIESVMAGGNDTLGDVYQEYAFPNPGTGQYFSPMPLAQVMAWGMCQGIEKEIRQRITDAVDRSPMAKAAAMAGLMLKEEDIPAYYFSRIVPLALPTYEPYIISDPCCGSGVMFIAAAEQLPAWVVHYNLVRFYGMDIDERCVKMTRTALRLRGLNGYAACALSATDQELAMLPKPYAVQYTEAREAHRAGDKERVLEILADVRGMKQATLF